MHAQLQRAEYGGCDSLLGHGGKKLSFLSLHLLKEGPCRYNPQNVAAKIREYVALPEDEDVLMDAVANQGPIASGMHVYGKSFSFYNEG